MKIMLGEGQEFCVSTGEEIIIIKRIKGILKIKYINEKDRKVVQIK